VPRALSIVLLTLAAGWFATPARAQTYTYDTAGRLTQVTYPDGTTISTTYDAAGNVVSHAVTASPPAGGGGGSVSEAGGCFIATAAYGSELHPHVESLREFRDERLLTNAPGRAFVRLYYATSPPLAAVIAEHESLRWLVRWALAPLVFSVAYPRAAAGLVLLLVATLWYRRRRAVCHAPSTA